MPMETTGRVTGRSDPTKILVVEDDTDFGNQLVDLFQYHGHGVVLARDGASAVDLFREHRPDLIVCDLMLPIQNGMKVIEEIRSAPGGDRVPAIMVSAVYRNPALFAQDLRRIGVERFIAKPFSLLELGQEVDELLRRRPEPSDEGPEGGEGADADEPEPVEARAERIRRDHRQRMRLDHYAFLGVAAEATQSEIESAYRELAPRYRVSEASELPDDARPMARDLLLRLIEAYEALADPESRRAYDATRAEAVRRAVGDRDPMDVDLPTFPQSIRDSIAEALARVRRGDVDEGVRLLHDLRQTWPASGEVLVALGWSRFVAGGSGSRATSEEALHWLQLALAYDPDLVAAHRCLAAVHADLGRRGEVVHHLQAVLARRPDDEQAARDLERLGAVGSPA